MEQPRRRENVELRRKEVDSTEPLCRSDSRFWPVVLCCAVDRLKGAFVQVGQQILAGSSLLRSGQTQESLCTGRTADFGR
jgi:hypothetical protein